MNIKYTKAQIIEGLKRFITEVGHEPTAQEINACHYLPSARQIQRAHGGLQQLRKEAGLATLNHTKGATRSATALSNQVRAIDYESKIIMALIKKYHDPIDFTTDVIREYAYQQYIEEGDWYKNIYSDVAIVERTNTHVTMFDFFYPKDMGSLLGCARTKLAKLKKHPVSLIPPYTSTVILVSVNPEIAQSDINRREISNKGVLILSYDQFMKTYLS